MMTIPHVPNHSSVHSFMGSIPRCQIHSNYLVCGKNTSHFVVIKPLRKRYVIKLFKIDKILVPGLERGVKYCNIILKYTANQSNCQILR